ncbi:MAG: gamma-glutamylcyclotransferase [Acidimicrobiia bacterium]|nr:gamma-glutamylcyclotransferase [Acidimicrobiia bacterium]MDQ3500670.1 hypothetical protein [Actinomycetota bacterium]
MHRLGVLAYGSLIDDPGSELFEIIVARVHGVLTPFPVEYARSSSSRDGGPTLVPVESGGARVKGVVLLLSEDTSEEEGASMLWRRETSQIGSGKRYKSPKEVTVNTVTVRRLTDFAGVGIVLYTHIPANIEQLTPSHLAELAIESATGDAGKQRRDGISYLLMAKRAGIVTPLMSQYDAAILSHSGAASLEDAWHRSRTLA